MFLRSQARTALLCVAVAFLFTTTACAGPFPVLVEQALALFTAMVQPSPTPPPPTSTPTPAEPEVTPAATAPAADFATLTIASYNVESGQALAAVVGDRLAAFTDVDLWGLSEVRNVADAEILEAAAEIGENANFEGVVGSTGGGDRLAILYNTERFTLVGAADELEHINVGGTIRAPLLVELFDHESGQHLVFMVNHLYRGRLEIEPRRNQQAQLLNEWTAADGRPAIAVGDYNFDWEVMGGESDHDPAYDFMTENDVWSWVRPALLVRTQCDVPSGVVPGPGDTEDEVCEYDSVLDFVFTANAAQDWQATSEIVVAAGDFPDDDGTSDHRPVLATFQLPIHTTLPPTPTTATPTPAAPTSTLPTPTPSPTATLAPGAGGLRLGELHFDGDVAPAESDEYIEIINEGEALNIAGWQLQDDDGNIFIFPDHTMAQGDRCRVYTNEAHPDSCGFSFQSPQSIWGNGGDVVILLDAEGVEIARECWGSGC